MRISTLLWAKGNLTAGVETHYWRVVEAGVLALEILLSTVFCNHPCIALTFQLENTELSG